MRLGKCNVMFFSQLSTASLKCQIMRFFKEHSTAQLVSISYSTDSNNMETAMLVYTED